MEEGVKDEVSLPEETEATDEIVEEGDKTPTTQAGDKTPPNLLLESLQEERRKRRELEQLLELKNKTDDDNVYSDEGRLLKQEINALNEKIALKELAETFPALKDKLSDFNEYKREFIGVPVEKVAKLFLAENNLLENPQPRKGLEKASGGIKTQPQIGLSQEEITDLRQNNGKKYYEMLKAGKIKV